MEANIVRNIPFQFTPLREGRRERVAQSNQQSIISIHAPPRGATDGACQLPDGERFQFTPLREGRPQEPARDNDVIRISIHAPPRGATATRRPGRIRLFGFQFTPLREGRRTSWGGKAMNKLFQFTPLREGRRNQAARLQTYFCISIHAPPRGATVRDGTVSGGGDYFNSRPSARGDLTRIEASLHMQFQFTPLREGRPAHPSPRRMKPYFNSRPSARGDSKRYAISANLLFNPYKSAWLNNRARQFVEIILVIFHRIIA